MPFSRCKPWVLAVSDMSDLAGCCWDSNLIERVCLGHGSSPLHRMEHPHFLDFESQEAAWSATSRVAGQVIATVAYIRQA